MVKMDSLFISELLDSIGYSYQMIKFRQRMLTEADKRCFSRYHERFTTGGKGEGTSTFCESDVDFMFVAKDVICSDRPYTYTKYGHITLFEIDSQNTAPGYTTLKLVRKDGKCYEPSIRASLLTSMNNEIYISSDEFTRAVKSYVSRWRSHSGVESQLKQGPSSPFSYKDLMVDNIRCFRYYCPDNLKNWASRPRLQDWPSLKDIHHISQLDSHVAPVGMKESSDAYIEWRVCYTFAEVHLMKNLNETQLKLNIILKKISKLALKPICGDITSYIMKNILMWVCEIKGTQAFVPKELLGRLVDCLKFFIQCLKENYLPNYMIPNRNLFTRRLNSHKRKHISNLLEIYVDERNILLVCKELEEGVRGMMGSMRMLRTFKEKRDELEMLVLSRVRINHQSYRPGMNLKNVEEASLRYEHYWITNRKIILLTQVDTHAQNILKKSNREISAECERIISQMISWGKLPGSLVEQSGSFLFNK